MILNIFFLKKLNFVIFKNNLINYNFILMHRYKYNHLILLSFPQFNKYNWCVNKSFFLKFININYLNTFNLKNFFFKNITIFDRLNNIIFFKKKSSIFKKNTDYEYTILNYTNRFKNNYYHNHNYNILESVKSSKKNDDYNFLNTSIKSVFTKSKFSKTPNYKTIDFNKKINIIFQKNRTLLRKILKVKFKRKGVFNKYIKNLTKLRHLDFLFNFEYRLVNLLVRSMFFFNYSDCLWFLKNGFISVNGYVVYNSKKILKPLEIVTLIFGDYYFYYYKYMLNNCISNLYRFGSKIWKINNSRINRRNREDEKYSNWIYKYTHYNNDIPKFIEVDYISMSMVLLNYSFEKKYIDFYNIKFLNLYLSRLYNWKTII